MATLTAWYSQCISLSSREILDRKEATASLILLPLPFCEHTRTDHAGTEIHPGTVFGNGHLDTAPHGSTLA